jgi:hypothetical protein
MGQPLTQLTFEQWLAHVFDHPVREPAWYFDLDAGWWDGPALDRVRFLTRAFEGAKTHFQPYTDAQLNQGLWYLASNACSSHMFAFSDETVDWAVRQRGLRAMRSLYAKCFAPRCAPVLGHLDEPGGNPLNLVCYMWFDLLPLFGQPEDGGRAALDREMLNLMAGLLEIDSVACQESALHGLGHWHYVYPEQTSAIIDAYLQRSTALRPELRQYAFSARRGCAL